MNYVLTIKGIEGFAFSLALQEAETALAVLAPRGTETDTW